MGEPSFLPHFVLPNGRSEFTGSSERTLLLSDDEYLLWAEGAAHDRAAPGYLGLRSSIASVARWRRAFVVGCFGRNGEGKWTGVIATQRGRLGSVAHRDLAVLDSRQAIICELWQQRWSFPLLDSTTPGGCL
jgi:hypothetical protein